MFINSIGDVHQSFTGEEGVMLFVLWGGSTADVPDTQLPQNSGKYFSKKSPHRLGIGERVVTISLYPQEIVRFHLPEQSSVSVAL